jgi:hypothetical protein
VHARGFAAAARRAPLPAERPVVPISGVVSYARFSTNLDFGRPERNDMATRKKKESAAATSGGAKKLTRSELKQKIRELKRKRKEAGTHSAKAKVHEFNEQLHVWRRKLRKAARHQSA